MIMPHFIKQLFCSFAIHFKSVLTSLLLLTWRSAAVLHGVHAVAWHAVMETTMVEPVWRGAFTPWHQAWHRAHPGFSAAWLAFPINFSQSPCLPLFLLSTLPFLRLTHSSFILSTSRTPTLLVFFPPPSLLPSVSLSMAPVYFSLSVSPLNFILSFAPQRPPFTLGT